MKGTYLTLCTTKKKALKAKKEIEEYFKIKNNYRD